jgi:hypothetical protein
MRRITEGFDSRSRDGRYMSVYAVPAQSIGNAMTNTNTNGGVPSYHMTLGLLNNSPVVVDGLLPSETTNAVYLRVDVNHRSLAAANLWHGPQFRDDAGNNVWARFPLTSGLDGDVTINGVVIPDMVLPAWTSGWNRVEAGIKVGEDGWFEVKVNGTTIFRFDGDIPMNGVSRAAYRYTPGNNASHCDNFIVNDSSGSSDNTWVGPRYLTYLNPNANGDKSDWMGSDGNKVNNFQLVNSNVTTTYVTSEGPGSTDLYNVQDITLPTGYEIKGLQIAAWMSQPVPDGTPGEVIYKTYGSEFVIESIQTLDPSIRCYSTPVVRKNPITGNDWTKAEVDLLQVGVRFPNE